MESEFDMLSRLRLMAEGNPKWDLSENDCAAIKYVLGQAALYREVMDERSTMNLFPSLLGKHPEPHGWIQWKGTKVCMDIRCGCGELGHIDDYGCYHVKCAACGAVYECDGTIALHRIYHEPKGTKDISDPVERMIDEILSESNGP